MSKVLSNKAMSLMAASHTVHDKISWDALWDYIAELEEENEKLKTACDILRGDNNLLFKRLMSIETPNDLQKPKIVYGKVCEE